MKMLVLEAPLTAMELELRLHNFCDHHGAWDAEVAIDAKLGAITITDERKEIAK